MFHSSVSLSPGRLDGHVSLRSPILATAQDSLYECSTSSPTSKDCSSVVMDNFSQRFNYDKITVEFITDSLNSLI